MGEAKFVEHEIDSSISPNPVFYVLDTNVLVHDPTSILNFDEHHVVIPIIVLEELDSLKSGRHSIAADCRQAIRSWIISSDRPVRQKSQPAWLFSAVTPPAGAVLCQS